MQHRRSRHRERILLHLQGTRTHPTADRIYAKLKGELPGLSLGTVYRNLGVLVEQGKVRRLPFGRGRDRYEAGIEPHYHLVCEQCGTVRDVVLPLYDMLNRQTRALGTFRVLHHRIDFYGICEKCLNKSTTQTRRKGT